MIWIATVTIVIAMIAFVGKDDNSDQYDDEGVEAA